MGTPLSVVESVPSTKSDARQPASCVRYISKSKTGLTNVWCCKQSMFALCSKGAFFIFIICMEKSLVLSPLSRSHCVCGCSLNNDEAFAQKSKVRRKGVQHIHHAHCKPRISGKIHCRISYLQCKGKLIKLEEWVKLNQCKQTGTEYFEFSLEVDYILQL